MEIKLKTAISITIAAALVFIGGSCSRLDVVRSDSERAFAAILDEMPPGREGNEWRIESPDRAAVFCFSGGSAGILIDARPFVEAGLNISAFSNADNGLIYIDRDFSNTERLITSPLEDYRNIIKEDRGALLYHAALNHYGIDLGGGNLFEWAKDINGNDKDIVFALEPAPFILAGADPFAVSGWVFTTVTVDDKNGKPVEAYKMLKAFNIVP